MKKLLVALFLVASGPLAFGQSEEHSGLVKWMTIEQALEKNKVEKRNIFVDVYTDWCGWCKVMDKNTFHDEQIAQILNEKFYPVKFNAEQTADVNFNGTVFKFVPSGNKGTHQLAAALLDNKLGYPTVVFIEENLTSVFPIAGYQAPDVFHKYLTFFADKYYKNGNNAWAEFEKIYKSPYPQVSPKGK